MQANKLREHWDTTLFMETWLIALAGIMLKLYYRRRFERLGIALYVLQSIVIASGPLAEALPLSGVILIGIGCLLYTIGVVLHMSERLPFHNAIWHGLVLAATGCHFAVIMENMAQGTLAR